jgi:phosphopantetheinyl transferase
MIYTIIAHCEHISLDDFSSLAKAVKIEEKDNINKMDCGQKPQSNLTLLDRENLVKILEIPKEIYENCEYKNAVCLAEHLLSYSALLYGLKKIFNLENPNFGKNEFGKPYLVFPENSTESKKIYFNISHSNGMVAVAISNEGEIGIDVQKKVCESLKENQASCDGLNDDLQEKENRLSRLEKRFLDGISKPKESAKVEYLLYTIDGGVKKLIKIDLKQITNIGFTEKWTLMESAIKLEGKGFSNQSGAREILEKTRSDLSMIDLENDSFAISITDFK